jgi:hypothetical protein
MGNWAGPKSGLKSKSAVNPGDDLAKLPAAGAKLGGMAVASGKARIGEETGQRTKVQTPSDPHNVGCGGLNH